MINKKGLWFLTLFSLILVLSVYYITMPSELLLGNNSSYTKGTEEIKQPKEEEKATVQTVQSDLLAALRVETENQVLQELEELEGILVDEEATTDEKNNAYEKIKGINITKGEAEKLEKQLKDIYKVDAFVKIDGDQIRVVLQGTEHDVKKANDIMRTVQSNYDKKMYISVKFQK